VRWGSCRWRRIPQFRSPLEYLCLPLADQSLVWHPSSQGSYYAVRKRLPSARAVRDAELVEDIKVAHKANLGVYGARKMHAELNRENVGPEDGSPPRDV
jgi:putative transposase